MAYGTVRGGRYAGYGALSSVRDCPHLPPGAGTVPSLVGACEAVIWSSTTAGACPLAKPKRRRFVIPNPRRPWSLSRKTSGDST